MFAMMRETLRLDLVEADVMRVLGPENVFETVEAAVGACLAEDAGAGPGEPEVRPPGE